MLTDLPATAAWFADNDPGVTSVVITGPTASVAEVVDATSPTDSMLLEVDFDRGAPEPCG